MRAAKTLLAMALVLLPRAAGARDVSSIALGPGQYVMMGLEVEYLEGSRPDFLSGASDYTQTTYWYRARGGTSDPTTDLGTQLGIEYDLRLGVTPEEDPAMGDRRPLGLIFRIGSTLRALTFNLPVDGSLSFYLSAELGVGGARWWAKNARLGVMGGTRLALKAATIFRVEADYTLVPLTVGTSGRDLHMDRLEHRLLLTLGIGPVGIGTQLLLARARSHQSGGSRRVVTQDRAASLYVAWRFEED